MLDVRREREWQRDGHIEGASWWPLDNFKGAPPEIDRHVPMAGAPQGRYRSMMACSLLQRVVFQNVVNVIEASTRGRKPKSCGCGDQVFVFPEQVGNLERSRW